MNPILPVIRQQLRPDRPRAMDGWTTPERAIDLAKFVLERKPEIVVEIGVFGGKALIALALACRQNGKGHVYGIDPWIKGACNGVDNANKAWWDTLDLEEIYRKAVSAVTELGLDKFVTIVRGQSHHVADQFSNIDFLEIDGCHCETCATRDVELYVPKVVSGGLIFMDDLDWHQNGKSTMGKVKALLNDWCVPIRDFGNARLFQKK